MNHCVGSAADKFFCEPAVNDIAADLRRILPHAYYLGFTGTPLLKRDKNTLVLLTGFDAPRNTVLYVCKQLRDHNMSL